MQTVRNEPISFNTWTVEPSKNSIRKVFPLNEKKKRVASWSTVWRLFARETWSFWGDFGSEYTCKIQTEIRDRSLCSLAGAKIAGLRATGRSCHRGGISALSVASHPRLASHVGDGRRGRGMRLTRGVVENREAAGARGDASNDDAEGRGVAKGSNFTAPPTGYLYPNLTVLRVFPW